MSTCNRLDLQTLGGSQPMIMPKISPITDVNQPKELDCPNSPRLWEARVESF